MYIWTYTGEVNAKRVREKYLQAVLRQDIAFFDTVGAGEVATRIQTDTRNGSPFITLFMSLKGICRSDSTRHVRESGTHNPVRVRLPYRFYTCLCSIMAIGARAFFDIAMYRHLWRHYEQEND